MRCRSAGPGTSAILSPMPEILPWHVRGQGLIAGQAPARCIRAPHMEFTTGYCIPLLPQQTAYILQVILAQFGRLAARSCTFRTRSILSLWGLLIPSSGRRRRWYYGQTTPLMVWYPRAPPSPTLADPMLPIGSDGEHRLWRHGTRLEAVRDHKWHGYYGNGARRNRTQLRPVTYYDGKSDFRRRKHLGIWRVLGSVCLLQTGLPRKKIQKKTSRSGFETLPDATDGPDDHPVRGVLFAETRERYTQERRLQEVTTLPGSLHRVNLSERAHGTPEGTASGLLGLNPIVCSDSSTRASAAECNLRGHPRDTCLKASRRGHVEEGIGGWNVGRDSRVAPVWTDRDTAHVRPASHTQLNRPAPKAWISRTTLVVSMAEAWDVAGAQPLFASYSPCGCVKCRMQRRDKGAYGSTAGTSKGLPDGDGVIVSSDSRSGTSGAMVRIDAWDGGGGTQVGPVRWMDGGPSPAIPAASTHLHWAEPQYLTAARTSKHMGLVGTDGAVTEGAVTWTTAGSTSQRGAEAALDRLHTAVSHGRKL